MCHGRGGEDVGVPVVGQDLDCVLADGGGAAPDEDWGGGVFGRVGVWAGPGEGEGEVCG